MYIEYLDYIPPIPEELLDSVEDILTVLPKLPSPIRAEYKGFQTRVVNFKLFNWLQDHFDFTIKCQYQIIHPSLIIHKDTGRTVAYNYLLAQGGPDVKTNIYSDDFETTYNILQSEIIPLKKWHRIDVSMFHGVHGINKETLRVALSVVPMPTL